MKLSEEDAELFYELWLPLLDYVNKKKGANKKLRHIRMTGSLEPAEVKKVADVLWKDTALIDEYLADNKDIEENNKEIISGWKRRVNGTFVVERILKKGAVFISLEDGNIYQVSGIVSSWEEMLEPVYLPLAVKAVLIPFRGVIITDGLIQPCNVIIGRNMAKSFKDDYMKAKKNRMIRQQL